MRKADHANPRGTNLGSRTEVGRAIEAIARLRLGRHQLPLIADFFDPARTEAVDKQRREPPSGETARPLAIVRTDAVAAMQHDNSSRRHGACRQIKLGRRVAERRADLGWVKDLCLNRSRCQTEKAE